MNNERELFIGALALSDTVEREAYLQEACGPDSALRRRVEALLDIYDNAGSFLQGPVNLGTTHAFVSSHGNGTEAVNSSPLEGPGTVIGPYKLLEPIGEGGMGVVYMAEQTLPVRRKVALKIIKPGMDTKQVIARFEAERQALALMDHPNIARVLDAGATESGRPYFVMELIKGIPITEYCDRNRLPIENRLELFALVCQAVQHAHQKGIIHRDLKPSNVMVTRIDGAAVPKVIDFGIAKAIGQRLTDKTLFTGFAQLIGTPLYMSPEQADLAGVDVDTRSDIYSLGVLLYQLVTGTTPFDQEMFRTAAFDEIRRIIREQEPPRPSTRISTLESTATTGTSRASTISANRQTDPHRLRKALRGELDWIVMKCLDKDRNRRYETANTLVADLRRYLSHEPVEAGPPSARYRLRKFVRRNRAALATAAVVAAALVAGTVVSTWEAIRATHAEGLAERRLRTERAARLAATQERNRADSARQEADHRATEAREVVDFLINDLIGAARPSRAQGQVPTVDQVLAQADKKIAKKFAGRPPLEASIRHTMAQAYEELGQYQKAGEHAARAVELRLAHLGPEHAETIAAQNALGWALRRQSRGEHVRASDEKIRTLLTPVLATARKALGPEHPETLETLHVLAIVLHDLSRDDEARALAEELLATRKRVLGPEHPKTVEAMGDLALIWRDTGKLEQARQLYEASLTIGLRDQPNHPITYTTMIHLANIYSSLGQFDRALDMRQRVLEGRLRVLGLAHPFTQDAIGAYFSSARRTDRINWEQTRKVLEPILDRSRRESEPQARLTFCVTATCLALLLRDHGRFAEARPLLEQSLAEALLLGKELPKRPAVAEARSLARVLLGRWPGLAPGLTRAERPPASLAIEAPFRPLSPVADGRITPGEYGTGIEARFDDDANPGRLWVWAPSRFKTPGDLSVRVLTAHTDRSLFLAFLVRDQFIDDSELDAKVPYMNDSVDVFINGDHVANDVTPGLLVLDETGSREGFQLVADAAGHQFTGTTAFTNADWKVGTSRTADGYIIEFEIPLALIDTKDGPDCVPAASGSELLVNFGITDNDDPKTADQTAYGVFWAEDPNLSPYIGGEDFWTVSLRLVPKGGP